jgi:hypothetical protein
MACRQNRLGESAYRRRRYLADVEALPVGRGSSRRDVQVADHKPDRLSRYRIGAKDRCGLGARTIGIPKRRARQFTELLKPVCARVWARLCASIRPSLQTCPGILLQRPADH